MLYQLQRILLSQSSTPSVGNANYVQSFHLQMPLKTILTEGKSVRTINQQNYNTFKLLGVVNSSDYEN